MNATNTCWICEQPLDVDGGDAWVEVIDADGRLCMHYGCHSRGTSPRLVLCSPAQTSPDAYNHTGRQLVHLAKE